MFSSRISSSSCIRNAGGRCVGFQGFCVSWGTGNRSIRSPSAGGYSRRSRRWQGHTPSGGSEAGTPCLFPSLVALSSCPLACDSGPLISASSSHGYFFLCVCVFVHTSLIGNQSYWGRAHPNDLVSTWLHPQRFCFQTRPHFHTPGFGL